MAATLSIGGREVSRTSSTFIIAEGCDNHAGRLGDAFEMARRAKLAGADAIKFQHHLPDEEMLRDVPMSSNFEVPLYDYLKKIAFHIEDHAKLKVHCESIGITYLCTPFSLAAARDLETIGVPAYKIGSGEMTDIPTLVRIAAFGRPMILSTGMSTFEEIDRTYQSLISRRTSLALLNCVSEYPPAYEDINLGVIRTMLERYPEAVIGHSDHSPDIYTSFAAVTLGARIIEKHVILDKRQPLPDASVSVDFRDFAELCDGIRKIEVASGREKKVHDREKEIRQWAFRSLVTTAQLCAGERISQEKIWSKRPGTGIPSYRMDEVIGRTARRDIPGNTLLSWEDLEP
jgi:N,N'-diacetyllegionaminate synthase